MKVLRNPVVVGILALVAVVMVAYQIFGDRLFRVRRLFTSKPAAAVANSTPAKPVAQPPLTAAAPNPAPIPPPIRAVTYTNLEAASLPSQAMDTALIERGFKSWVSAPLRDPFLLLVPIVREPGLLNDETNSPVATWSLQAIWNQTDSRLAVINDQVWSVGDVLQPGYKLIRIERDEVWFQGPHRNERLGFPEPKRMTPRIPPPSTQPPRGGERT
jgi:hypothetical protein